MMAFFEYVGGQVLKLLEYLGALVILLGETLAWILRGAIRLGLTVQQMAHLGVDSLVIVVLTTTTVGMVISLQLAHIAVKYGVASVVGGGVAIAMAREMGPGLTAVVVAGRAGAAITAELGTMRVTEQIDAMRVMAVSPVRYLVVPRLLALLAMMPVLTIFSMVAGTLGGAVIAYDSAGIPYDSFFDSVQRLTVMDDIYGGLQKSLVFAIEIALVACHQGLTCPRGAAGVGLATTRSVVFATIILFITNYFMSAWLFPVTG
ncbi:MAG TPA: ABC transporter permease [Candidatus Nitrosotenuis sp.]|jgi:phospholipid/cholesterol/gamma-HCH transport system permease protein|nr:ABC transporter permease [Candidatus Nitrosotenuis sp.]